MDVLNAKMKNVSAHLRNVGAPVTTEGYPSVEEFDRLLTAQDEILQAKTREIVPLKVSTRHELWDVLDARIIMLLVDWRMEIFGLAKLDYDLDLALCVAISTFVAEYERGQRTAVGMAIMALRTFIWKLPQFRDYLTPESREILEASATSKESAA
jgi:hypothetical protein